MIIIIRFVLTTILLVLAYGETGPWTILILALISISNEINAFLLKMKEIENGLEDVS